ncbi:hypothetical protein ACFTWH_21715 [Streptomyces sp. NPDC057011]|uniref:hypothetical protein n=1 Tax=unclassified Streptomyces TaxID=2593676 RepID=UPI0036373406
MKPMHVDLRTFANFALAAAAVAGLLVVSAGPGHSADRTGPVATAAAGQGDTHPDDQGWG